MIELIVIGAAAYLALKNKAAPPATTAAPATPKPNAVQVPKLFSLVPPTVPGFQPWTDISLDATRPGATLRTANGTVYANDAMGQAEFLYDTLLDPSQNWTEQQKIDISAAHTVAAQAWMQAKDAATRAASADGYAGRPFVTPADANLIPFAQAGYAAGAAAKAKQEADPVWQAIQAAKRNPGQSWTGTVGPDAGRLLTVTANGVSIPAYEFDLKYNPDGTPKTQLRSASGGEIFTDSKGIVWESDGYGYPPTFRRVYYDANGNQIAWWRIEAAGGTVERIP